MFVILFAFLFHSFCSNLRLETIVTTKLDSDKDDEVFSKGKDDEYDANKDPDNEGAHAIRLGNACCDGVVHIDHHEKDSEKQTEASRDNIKADSKADPAGDDHEDARDKVEPDVGTRFSLEI